MDNPELAEELKTKIETALNGIELPTDLTPENED